MSDVCNDAKSAFGASCKGFDPGYLVSFYLSAMSNNDNVPNNFANRAAVTKSAVQAKIALANTAPDEALFPIGLRLDNLEDTVEDPTYEDLSSGARVFIRKGKRVVVAMVPLVSWQFIEQSNNWKSGDNGIYMLNNRADFQYETDSTGEEVNLIRIQKNSFHASEVPGLPESSGKVRIEFTLDDSYQPAKIRSITKEDLGFNPLSNVDVPELIETKTNIISANATTTVFTLKSVFDLPVTGQGDPATTITLKNVTQDSVVTLTSIVETPATPGEYTLTYAAGVTLGDIVSPQFTDADYYTYNSNQNTKVSA